MPRLEIQLVSPLAAGSGFGRPGVVDREVVFDVKSGLPYLPGRRLKGLLRDAYRNLFESGALAGLNPPHPSKLFGAPGESAPGLLAIGNGRLVADGATKIDGRGIAGTLRALVRAKGSPVSIQDVVRYFTEIRRQTAIDRATGAARRDTLRFTRVLRKGLVFEAIVDVLPDWALEALAVAAAGVDAMGSARSRGWGVVSFTVFDDAGSAVNPRAIARLRSNEALPAAGTPPVQPPETIEDIDLTPRPPTHGLRFRLELTEPVLLPRPVAGDPNTAVALDCVPGTTVMGVLAAAYLRNNGPDRRFRELFQSGHVVFQPAAPLQRLEDADGVQWAALSPSPHSVREWKDARPGGDAVDLAWAEPEDRVKRIEEHWYNHEQWLQGKPSPKFESGKTIQYHHQRAHDARVQRALGNEPEDFEPYQLRPGQQGALFAYESLGEGARFEGSILGQEEDLTVIRALLPGGEIVRIGRSRSAQYGGSARWEWVELGAFEPKLPEPPIEKAAIRLLTPLITRNEYGHPVASVPANFFGEGTQIVKQFTRREFQGGYFSHQNLPREQVPCLAAGSTFVVEGRVNARELVTRSFGLRTEEGFGRLAVEAEYELPRKLFAKPDPESMPTAGNHPCLEPLLKAVLIGKLEDRARQEARRLAESDRTSQWMAIRPHLIHRTILVIEQDAPFAALRAFVADVKGRARGQFDKVIVQLGGQPDTLFEFLEKSAQDRGPLIQQIASGLSGNWGELLGARPVEIVNADAELADRLARTYLIQFLSALARRRKRGEN